MNDKEEKKAAREREVFEEFCRAAGIPLQRGSVESRRPPEPDVRCRIAGRLYYAELVEVTDEGLAKNVSWSLKTGEITGGSFSQDGPLSKSFREKSTNRYETNGAPLLLVAYYDKQYAFDHPEFWAETIGSIANPMVGSGAWHSVWVYDTWQRRILWNLGRNFSGRKRSLVTAVAVALAVLAATGLVILLSVIHIGLACIHTRDSGRIAPSACLADYRNASGKL